MIKYYCDRCREKIPPLSGNSPLTGRAGINVCWDCAKGLDNAQMQAKENWLKGVKDVAGQKESTPK